jgi:long-chain acyl-CoA synthetase
MLMVTPAAAACSCSGNDPLENIRGTVGHPLPGTLIRVVDPVTLQPVPDGQQGLLLAQGPGVMAGYWQDPAATSKALFDGWFDTGGLQGW